jgi:hypothetical protein
MEVSVRASVDRDGRGRYSMRWEGVVRSIRGRARPDFSDDEGGRGLCERPTPRRLHRQPLPSSTSTATLPHSIEQESQRRDGGRTLEGRIEAGRERIGELRGTAGLDPALPLQGSRQCGGRVRQVGEQEGRMMRGEAAGRKREERMHVADGSPGYGRRVGG